MNATKLTELLSPPDGITITDVTPHGPGGCYERIDIKYEATDGINSDDAVEIMKKAWKKKYPGTIPNFKKSS